MKRTTVSAPDGLMARLRELDLNASEIFRRAVEQAVAGTDECSHSRVRCESCGAYLDAAAVELDEGPPAG